MPILLIVAAAIAAVGIGVTGWQIWKATALGIPWWVWIIGGAGLLAVFLFSDTGKQMTGTAIKAGKVYVTKGALK